MASAYDTLTLCKILSESKRIIKAHLHNFQALTALFVFPLSLSTFFYLALQKPTFQCPFQSNNSTNFIIILLYSIFASLISLCAFSTIVYTTYNGFYGEPVSLVASIKSIFTSFLPYLSTILVSEIILVLIVIPYTLLAFLVYKWLQFLPLVIYISLVFIVLITFLQVNWILAYVVVVVESKWGYEPFKRSAYLVKGNRGVAFSMILCTWIISLLVYFGFPEVDWRSWGFWIYVVFGSFCLSLVSLFNLVGIVVLYVYCKDFHEGLPLENSKKQPLLK